MTKKTLCIMVALLLVLSLNGSTFASTSEEGTQVFVYCGGSVSIYDLPISTGEWREDGATQEVVSVRTWDCPCEEEYYLNHGRLRNLLDYLSLTEYEVFRATSMTLAEFLALRASGMMPAEILAYELGHSDNVFNWYDLPFVYGEWLECYGTLEALGLLPTWDYTYEEEYYGEIFNWYDLPFAYGEWREDVVAPSRILRFPIGATNFTDNGVSYTLESAPFIQNDRTMVPLRVIGEALGATDLAHNAGVITFNIGSQAFTMTIGQELPDNMGIPVIVADRTFVPLAFIINEMGATARWDNEARAAYIYIY